jgi:hypothetical protein
VLDASALLALIFSEPAVKAWLGATSAEIVLIR